jgi:carbonic anhydrase/acetyltransferase-like protein (isoleucine patch superfamily)
VTILPYKQTEPSIGSNTYIAPGAYVIGDTIIGESSSVWFNTVIRGDVNFIRIGHRSNIQDNSTVHVTSGGHPTVIGDDVTIGHNAIIHAATIGDACLIGMGAIVLDGAQIGKECLIGAGSLVGKGAVIPPRSLVYGSPAKVIRSLTDDEVKGLYQSAVHYVDVARQYLPR